MATFRNKKYRKKAEAWNISVWLGFKLQMRFVDKNLLQDDHPWK